MFDMLDLLDGITMLCCMYRYDMVVVERILFCLLCMYIEKTSVNTYAVCIAKYWMIQPLYCICFLYDINILEMIYNVYKNIQNDLVSYVGAHNMFMSATCYMYIEVFLIILLTICLVLSMAIVQYCEMNNRKKTNIMRKLCHLYVYCIFYKPLRVSIIMIDYIYVIVIVVSTGKVLRDNVLYVFNSKRDKGCNILTSPIYLIMSVMIPYHVLQLHEYRSQLTAICVLDSVASVVGIQYDKKGKSLLGSLCGILVSTACYYMLEDRLSCFYFCYSGFVEYLDIYNDNISIALLSILYYKVLVV